MNTPTVPSPTPPWHRPLQSPNTNSLFGDGTMQLNYDTTYLSSNQIRMVDNAPSPYVIALPNGNYKRQRVHIYGDPDYVKLNTSATFIVTGQISGMTSLQFDNIGFSAILEWVPGVTGDGYWTFVGGNATAVP